MARRPSHSGAWINENDYNSIFKDSCKIYVSIGSIDKINDLPSSKAELATILSEKFVELGTTNKEVGKIGIESTEIQLDEIAIQGSITGTLTINSLNVTADRIDFLSSSEAKEGLSFCAVNFDAVEDLTNPDVDCKCLFFDGGQLIKSGDLVGLGGDQSTLVLSVKKKANDINEIVYIFDLKV